MCAVTLVLLAALGGPAAARRFASTADEVAKWTPSTEVSPWELSQLDDADLMRYPDHEKGVYLDRIWPNRTIFYFIDIADFEEDEIKKIRDVIEKINQYSCLKFEEAKSIKPNFVRIQGKKSEGCYSDHCGCKGGPQKINLEPPKCVESHTIFHELFHVIGFRHMHNHPRRDRFIRVIWNNISPKDQHHFQKYPDYSASKDNVTDWGLPYDYENITHFSRRAYSNNSRDTIETHDVSVTIGRWLQPTEIDIAKLKRMYQC